MSDLFVADDTIADVQVRSPTQLYVFGKKPGETTVSATTKTGAVVYSATVRVGNNFDSIGPDAAAGDARRAVVATPMNGLVLLTGTVASPQDAAEAERLVQAFVGDRTKVLSRAEDRDAAAGQPAGPDRRGQPQLRQEHRRQPDHDRRHRRLPVRRRTGRTARRRSYALIAACRSAAAGSVPARHRSDDGGRHRTPAPRSPRAPAHHARRPAASCSGSTSSARSISARRIGQVTTLANPNLTALSGETATFLAGGEIPIPISQGLGAVSVEYKQYGISLAYTPTVLSDGRISLRVRPEVSRASTEGAVTIGGTHVPGADHAPHRDDGRARFGPEL